MAKCKVALISILNQLKGLIYLICPSAAALTISVPCIALHFCVLSFTDLHEVSKQQGLYAESLSTPQIPLLSS